MIAILSDIHGNLAALKAVLEDIERRKVDKIFCLGDIVGYGPEPLECLKLGMSFETILMGNHEEAVLFGTEGFSARAASAVKWTRKTLEGQKVDDMEAMDLLGSLPTKYESAGICMVHGSPRNPTQEYIFPADIAKPAKIKEILEMMEGVCFVGHTHYAGVITERMEFFHPAELQNVYLVEGKCIVNVGSVGQPRDGDPRASYVTFDGDSVVFRRVEYDIRSTVTKIHRTAGLDNSLGDRLLVGR